MGKTNIRFIALLAGILLCHLDIQGQVKIRLSGKVTDREGNPVEQATIAIENSSAAASTAAEDRVRPLTSGASLAFF